MNLLLLIAGFALFWAVVGLCLRPVKLGNVMSLGFFGGITGAEAALAWWLASFDTHGLTRYLLNGVIGIVVLAFLVGLGAMVNIARTISHEGRLVIFKKKKTKMCSFDIAAALFYSVTRPDFQERDWKKVRYPSLDPERFFFERSSFRFTATWLAANETLALPERLAVSSKCEMLMREVDPAIVTNCDPYINAYETANFGDLKMAALAVADVFSKRCCGKMNSQLTEFAYLSFISLYDAQKIILSSCEVELDQEFHKPTAL
jgi:hypothetical protein